MFNRSSTALAIFAVLSWPASAATVRTFSFGNWSGGAYSNDVTQAFDHCAANARYNSGIFMGFIIDRNFNWSMRFSHPAWRLEPGQSFNIAFTVDDMSPLSATAVALTSNIVDVRLADNLELFTRFRHGRLLRVAAANQVFDFSLRGTSQLLPILLNCAQNKGAVMRMASNPFAPKFNNSITTVDDQAKEKAEAIAFAANLLSSAGIQKFTLLSPTDYPQIKGEARWIAGPTFGSVDILAKTTAEQLKGLSAFLIGSDAKSCKGIFFSGAVPDDGKGILSRVFTTCQKKGDAKPITVYYLAIPRNAGGAYIISTLSIGSETPAKEADATLRAAVLKVSSQPTSPLQN
jgi:hypothetical protein